MKKKVFLLYRTDSWHSCASRELLVVADNIGTCCEVARDDGATEGQLEGLCGFHHQSQCTSGTDYEYDIDTYTLNGSLVGKNSIRQYKEQL